ncbi:MAG: DNA mismatch repair protein MutS, partial [Bacteroidota bacterium]
MQHFDQRTLHDLEFPIIREWLVDLAVGLTARNRLEQLEPVNQFAQIERELGKVNELMMIRTEGESFPALDFEELILEIKLLPVRNAVLALEGYSRISRSSELVNTLIIFFNKREKSYPLLHELFRETYFTTELIDAINRIFDRSGNVKDDASPLLNAIRQKIKVLRNQINRNFD